MATFQELATLYAALPDILNDWEARCDVLLDLEESDERAAWEHGTLVA